MQEYAWWAVKVVSACIWGMNELWWSHSSENGIKIYHTVLHETHPKRMWFTLNAIPLCCIGRILLWRNRHKNHCHQWTACSHVSWLCLTDAASKTTSYTGAGQNLRDTRLQRTVTPTAFCMLKGNMLIWWEHLSVWCSLWDPNASRSMVKIKAHGTKKNLKRQRVSSLGKDVNSVRSLLMCRQWKFQHHGCCHLRWPNNGQRQKSTAHNHWTEGEDLFGQYRGWSGSFQHPIWRKRSSPLALSLHGSTTQSNSGQPLTAS